MDKTKEMIISAWGLTYMSGEKLKNRKKPPQNKLGYGSTQRCAGLAPCYCIIKPFGASDAVTTDTGCLQMLLQDMGRHPCGKKCERFTDVSCISLTSQREVGRARIAGEMMKVATKETLSASEISCLDYFRAILKSSRSNCFQLVFCSPHWLCWEISWTLQDVLARHGGVLCIMSLVGNIVILLALLGVKEPDWLFWTVTDRRFFQPGLAQSPVKFV